MSAFPVLLESITDIAARHAGCVAVSGSHGGVYPATVASRGRLRAVVLNDAGIGFEQAGIAGLAALDTVGMAAVASGCLSCRIGSARDCLDNGVLSSVNRTARALGAREGQRVAEALAYLEKASEPMGLLPEIAEARRHIILPETGLELRLLDSASLVAPEDEGAVLVTGSHGGLVGGDPKRALKADARLAVFHDAGRGKDDFGIARLPALDLRGVAAVTVSHETARIGDAESIFEVGILSACNNAAAALGARPGLSLRDWLATLPLTGARNA